MYRPSNIQFVGTNTYGARRIGVGRENLRWKQALDQGRSHELCTDNNRGHEQKIKMDSTLHTCKKRGKKGQSSNEPSESLPSQLAEQSCICEYFSGPTCVQQQADNLEFLALQVESECFQIHLVMLSNLSYVMKALCNLIYSSSHDARFVQ